MDNLLYITGSFYYGSGSIHTNSETKIQLPKTIQITIPVSEVKTCLYCGRKQVNKTGECLGCGSVMLEDYGKWENK